MYNMEGEKMYKILSDSVEKTMEIANKLAYLLKIGDIIVLNGDLGSGKTYFVKGIVNHYMDSNSVSSPTFTIVNEYDTNPPIYHFDVYRLEKSEEFLNIGGEEYLYNGISLIEWGEKIKDVLPHEYLEVQFSKLDGDNRELLFIPHGDKYIAYMEEYIKWRY